jgi:hypothetical protein
MVIKKFESFVDSNLIKIYLKSKHKFFFGSGLTITLENIDDYITEFEEILSISKKGEIQHEIYKSALENLLKDKKILNGYFIKIENGVIDKSSIQDLKELGIPESSILELLKSDKISGQIRGELNGDGIRYKYER